MITADQLKNFKAQLTFVTPQMADGWLEKYVEEIANGENTNRKPNPHDIDRYAADVIAGAWVPNNQGIGFDEDGHLVDGQKRLFAIKKARVGAWLLVVTGMPKQYENGLIVRTRDTIDFVQPRTVRGQWQMDSVDHSNLLATSVRLIAILCNDFSRVKISMSQANRIREIYQRHVYGIINNLANLSRVRGHIIAPMSLYRAINREKADAFASQFASMSNLPTGSPVLAMAKYFMSNKSSAGTESQKQAMRVVATAIHAYERGEQLQIARPNATALEWLVQGNKGNVRKVREILNVDIAA